MRTFTFLATVFLFGGFSSPPIADRPNILVIIADDMGVDAWGRTGIGTEFPKTPNIDALQTRV